MGTDSTRTVAGFFNMNTNDPIVNDGATIENVLRALKQRLREAWSFTNPEYRQIVRQLIEFQGGVVFTRSLRGGDQGLGGGEEIYVPAQGQLSAMGAEFAGGIQVAVDDEEQEEIIRRNLAAFDLEPKGSAEISIAKSPYMWFIRVQRTGHPHVELTLKHEFSELAGKVTG